LSYISTADFEFFDYTANKTSSLSGDEPLPRPSAFLIYDFAVDPEDVMVDTTGLTSADEA
jgi:hypothetical protein